MREIKVTPNMGFSIDVKFMCKSDYDEVTQQWTAKCPNLGLTVTEDTYPDSCKEMQALVAEQIDRIREWNTNGI